MRYVILGRVVHRVRVVVRVMASNLVRVGTVGEGVEGVSHG